MKKKSKKKPERYIPKGITVSTVPDLSLRVSKPVQESSNTLSVLQDNLTEEQRAVKEASLLSNKLLQEDEINNLVKSLITFRRGYAIAYKELQSTLELKNISNNLIEDFLIQFAMYEATKSFSEHTFMQDILNIVLPCLTDIIDSHSKEEEKRLTEEKITLDQERRSKPLPINMYLNPVWEDKNLPRLNTLVFVGHKNSLLWLIDNILTTLSNINIIYFMSQAPTNKEQSYNLIRIAPSCWLGAANSNKKLALCMGTYVMDKLSTQPDLLIIGDLSKAYTMGFIGRPDAANAGDAHKYLRRWCNEAGCGLIGLLPNNSKEEVNLQNPEYEQLRVFTCLRVVKTLEIEDNYEVTIGDNHNDFASFIVSKEIIDSYDSKKVLV